MTRMSVREAISQALREEMYRDERVFIMGEEIGKWGGTYAVTRGFLDEFGEKRVKDTPIAEGVIAGAAAGAAIAGLRPVAELMTINFAFLAMDAIVNHIAKLHYMFNGQIKVPLVIRTVGGGGRQLGATHSQTPDAVFAHFPGLKVVAPGTRSGRQGAARSPRFGMTTRSSSSSMPRFTRRRARCRTMRILPCLSASQTSSARATTSPSSPTRRCCKPPWKPPSSWPRKASRRR